MSSLYGPQYGSAYFSAVLGTIFYGAACIQASFYYVHYPDDSWRMKMFVAVIWALNTTQEALSVAGAYKCIMAGLVNPSSFLSTAPELVLQVVPAIIIAVLTQGFLLYRVQLLSGKKTFALLMWLIIALLQFVPCIVYVRRALYTSNGSVYVVSVTMFSDNTLTTPYNLCLAVGAAGDILISAFLVFSLARQRSRTNFVSTEHMLQRLTVFAVNTGTWSAMFALLSVIFENAFSSTTLFALFVVPLPSIYCNTVLANLNARVYFNGMTQNSGVEQFATFPMPSRQIGGDAAGPIGSPRRWLTPRR